MQEVKKPKKPLIYYYVIVMAILLLVNFLLMPWMAQNQVQEVDYGTFMTMTENKQIEEVQVDQEENQILFTDRNNNIYKTGMMDDPDLTQRLFDSGAKFSGEIVEHVSPVVSFLVSWILPILIFVGIGQYMSRKMMSKAGGPSRNR